MNGNHLLMANISELHEYQTFYLMKMHNMSKIWFANNKFEKVWSTINVPSKMFCFPFSCFQISNDYCQKPYGKTILFIMDLERSSDEMHLFRFTFFLNERNITTSLLMIYLKCTFAHYANLNSRPINKLL